MKISASNILSDRHQSNGKRYVSYRCLVEDNLGEIHEHTIGPFTAAAGFDAAADLVAKEPQVLTYYSERERAYFVREIERSNNPFEAPPLFNDRAGLLKHILDLAFRLPPTEPIVYNGLPLLDKVTDAELTAAFGFTQLQIDTIRANKTKLLGAKISMDEYKPVLGDQ